MSSDDLEKRLARLLKKAAKEADRERLDFLLDEIHRLLAARQKNARLAARASEVDHA